MWPADAWAACQDGTVIIIINTETLGGGSSKSNIWTFGASQRALAFFFQGTNHALEFT